MRTWGYAYSGEQVSNSRCEIRKNECAGRQFRIDGGFFSFTREYQHWFGTDGDSGLQVTQRIAYGGHTG